MTPTRTALPVSRIGAALSEEGDAYVASLDVELRTSTGSVTLEGASFEALSFATGLRHLMFHARTRAALPGSVRAVDMARRIETRWSSVESHDVCGVAERVLAICTGDGEVSWRVANPAPDAGPVIDGEASPSSP